MKRKPGRPAAVPARAIVARLRRVIARHAGQPCPTTESMAATLDVNEHAVRRAVRLLETRGELEIQRTAWIGGLRRRMRVKRDGAWCEWTALTLRRAFDLAISDPDLLGADAHHVARVVAAGRYD